MTDGPSGILEVRAQVACFDEDRLLCARHRKGGEAYLVLPGGHVERGETLPEAARREMAEETGVEAGEIRLWAVGEFHSSERHVIDLTFYAIEWAGRARLGSDPDAGVRPPSLAGLAWLDRSALAGAPFRPEILRKRLLRRWADPEAPFAYLGAERA